jgi:hypothetical protein
MCRCTMGGAEGPVSEPIPSPPASEITGFGYDDAVRLGAAWAQQLGYQADMANAKVTSGRNWIVRFGVVKDGRQRQMQITLDPETRHVTRSEELRVQIALPDDRTGPGAF